MVGVFPPTKNMFRLTPRVLFGFSLSRYTLPETNSKSPWKCMVGIRSGFPIGVPPIFRGENAVSFREVTSWWFQTFLEFSPRTLGKMNPFWLIFFKWVGSTTGLKPPTRGINFWVSSSQFLAPGVDAFSARSLTTRWFLWGKNGLGVRFIEIYAPEINHRYQKLPCLNWVTFCKPSFWGPQFVSFRGCWGFKPRISFNGTHFGGGDPTWLWWILRENDHIAIAGMTSPFFLIGNTSAQSGAPIFQPAMLDDPGV